MVELDPIAPGREVETKPLSPRIDGLDGKHIGLLDNGKRAAEPVLQVVEDRLNDRYPDASISSYHVDELNLLKEDDEIARIESWAEDVDIGITAIGDCGSCTKMLTWGTNTMERAGTPAVGLIDGGFELDWIANSKDQGRKLRYYELPVHSEVTDRDRIRANITPDVIDGIADELTRPLTAAERACEEHAE